MLAPPPMRNPALRGPNEQEDSSLHVLILDTANIKQACEGGIVDASQVPFFDGSRYSPTDSRAAQRGIFHLLEFDSPITARWNGKLCAIYDLRGSITAAEQAAEADQPTASASPLACGLTTFLADNGLSRADKITEVDSLSIWHAFRSTGALLRLHSPKRKVNQALEGTFLRMVFNGVRSEAPTVSDVLQMRLDSSFRALKAQIDRDRATAADAAAAADKKAVAADKKAVAAGKIAVTALMKAIAADKKAVAADEKAVAVDEKADAAHEKTDAAVSKAEQASAVAIQANASVAALQAYLHTLTEQREEDKREAEKELMRIRQDVEGEEATRKVHVDQADTKAGLALSEAELARSEADDALTSATEAGEDVAAQKVRLADLERRQDESDELHEQTSDRLSTLEVTVQATARNQAETDDVVKQVKSELEEVQNEQGIVVSRLREVESKKATLESAVQVGEAAAACACTVASEARTIAAHAKAAAASADQQVASMTGGNKEMIAQVRAQLAEVHRNADRHEAHCAAEVASAGERLDKVQEELLAAQELSHTLLGSRSELTERVSSLDKLLQDAVGQQSVLSQHQAHQVERHGEIRDLHTQLVIKVEAEQAALAQHERQLSKLKTEMATLKNIESGRMKRLEAIENVHRNNN